LGEEAKAEFLKILNFKISNSSPSEILISL